MLFPLTTKMTDTTAESSRVFFFLLALSGDEVCDALLDSEGSQSGLTAVQPALLDDLRHTVEHLQRREKEREGERARKKRREKEEIKHTPTCVSSRKS